MQTSEQINELATALSKAQAEFKPAAMDGKANYGKYATLGAIIDSVRPALAKHDLAFSQAVDHLEDSGMCLVTRLMHTSGQYQQGIMPLPNGEGRNVMQALGGVITYARRYALSAMLGVYADEDTDGNEPKAKPAQKRKPQNNGTSEVVTVQVQSPPETSGRPDRAFAESLAKEPPADSLRADLMAKLNENGPVTLATLASAVIAGDETGHYDNNPHVYNALAKWPELPDGYNVTGNTRMKGANAARAAQWLWGRVEVTE